MERIIIQTVIHERPVIKLDKKTAEDLGIENFRFTNVRFGYKSVETEVLIEDTTDKRIFFSNELTELLMIPTDCSYHLLKKKNELVVGPFIGILMGSDYEKNLVNKLRAVQSYIKSYSDINGVVCAFTLDQINTANLKIKCFFYNPKLDIWEFSELPYPDVVFRKSTLNKGWREYFAALYPSRIFNYKSLDKWETMERLNKFEDTENAVPATKVCNNPNDLIAFFREHKNIYLKPIKGSKGQGIFNAYINGENIILKSREERENFKWEFSNYEDFILYITSNINLNNYLVQKTLDISRDGKIVDFRLSFDKNESGEWENHIFLARVSDHDNVVSNIASGGLGMYPEDALKNVLKMTDEEVEYYKNNLRVTGKRVAEKLDSDGICFGKFGMDLTIDNKGHVWIIEVNTRYPDDGLMVVLKDYQTINQIRRTNMLYSKALGGFKKGLYKYTAEIAKDLKDSKNIRKRYLLHISGKVQGVGYRKYVKNAASELQLAGTIKNNEYKRRVDIEIEGGVDDIIQFIKNIKIGTTKARVTAVGIKELELLNQNKGFYISK
ncbi:YheC/YheD family protein [Evansella clarkii]|uniref:YheC/YheD family protein n=1 Tax=Evansella clarkii TaxID=79879 RepID=UPI000B43029E|nr:YheC/YheD family protein [Evansella clarkii]